MKLACQLAAVFPSGCVAMPRGATLLLACLLLPLLTWVHAADTNLALNQPTAQYTTYQACNGSLSADRGVNGVAADVCTCSHTTSSPYLPMRPWWMVQLSRWIRIRWMRISYRNDGPDQRDVGYTYSMGPFWNRALFGTVATTDISSDPLRGSAFSFLHRIADSMSLAAPFSRVVNLTTTASGRYFAVQSSNPAIPMVVGEVEVYGDANWLRNVNPSVTVADSGPFQSYNWSRVNDEDETTCLTMLDASVSRNVRLSYSTTKTGRFLVSLYLNGTVQPQQTGNTCSVGTFVGVTLSRQSAGAVVPDYTCPFSDTRSDGTKSYHSFICDCSTCTSTITIWLFRNAATGVDALNLCEVLAFDY